MGAVPLVALDLVLVVGSRAGNTAVFTFVLCSTSRRITLPQAPQWRASVRLPELSILRSSQSARHPFEGGPGSCQCDLDDTTKCIRDGNQITEAHTDIGSSEGIAPLPETSGEQT